MKKNTWSIIFLGCTIFTFIIVSFVGYFYFQQYNYHWVIQMILALQNSISVFVFSPIIGPLDMIEYCAMQSVVWTGISYVYALALFAAGLCTIAALYNVFIGLITKFIFAKRSWFVRENPLVIFGYNQKTQYLIQNVYDSKEYKITLVTNEVLSEAEKADFRKKGIQLFELDVLSLEETENDCFMRKLAKANKIILFETAAIRNFSIYTFLEKRCNMFEKSPKCYLYCDDNGIREIIEEYHANVNNKKKIDISIFNLGEMKVREIFKDEHALVEFPEDMDENSYINHPSQFDVHLLIVGFGSVGEQTLLHALNQGVVHSGSRIWVDVIDNDVLTKEDFFMKRFHKNYICASEASADAITYTLSGDACDGELMLRFHHVDIRSKTFPGLLDKLIVDKDKTFEFTRVVACFKEVDNIARCIMEIKKHVNRVNTKRIEMTVCAGLDKSLIEYFDTIGDDKMFVRAAGDDATSLCLENIIDTEKEDHAKEYSYTYNRIYNLLYNGKLEELKEATQQEIDAEWATQNYENKISNYLLGEHDVIKQKIISKICFAQEYENMLMQKGSIVFDEKGEYVQKQFIKNISLEENRLVKEMLKLEHRRWNYFSALCGWGYIKQESSKKDPIEKVHPCLSNFEILVNEHPDKVVFDLIPVLIRKYIKGEKDGKL